MKFRLNLNAEVQKLAGNFGFNDGEGKFNCDLEVELAPEEMMEVIKAQKELVPGVLNFVKEMQEISSERYYNEEKIDKLEKENEALKKEVSKHNIKWKRQ